MTVKFFKDLKVVELSSVLAGPAVGMFFAELGAEVIKVENSLTGGDVTRSWKLATESDAAVSAYYHSVNWNKKSLFKNLKDPSEKAEVLELIKDADIVISNFRPASARKMGFTYDQLKAINPTLIMGVITAYGDQDDRPGFDALMQAESGWMHMNGAAGGPPIKLPVALMDILSAHQLKEGLLLALLHRYKTGDGSRVSVSLYDSALSALANQASNYLNLQHNPQRKGSLHPNIAPYGEIIMSQEGIPLLLAIGNQKQFEGLCEILNCEVLLQDPRYADNKSRVSHRHTLIKSLQEKAALRSADDILAAAQLKSVPLGPINDLKTVFSSEHAQRLILAQTEPDGSLSRRVKTVVFDMHH